MYTIINKRFPVTIEYYHKLFELEKAISLYPIVIYLSGGTTMFVKRGRDDVDAICVEDLFGGHGKVWGRQILGQDSALIGTLPGFPDDFESGIHFIHETVIDVGTLVGEHPHEGSEEVYFFIEGTAKMIVDGEETTLMPGDAIITKNKSRHSIENIGDVPVRIIVIEGGVG